MLRNRSVWIQPIAPVVVRTYTRFMPTTEPIKIAQRAVELASDMQATNIILLDIREMASFADYFVVLSADNIRLINALVSDLILQLKREGILLGHKEGTSESGWILLDYGNVLIHIFSPEERVYYRLEELWNEAIPLLQVQ